MSIALSKEIYIMRDGKGGLRLKILDLSKTVYQLSKDDEEFIKHMEILGFDGIVSKTSLQTVGRIMTIKKGAKVKGIDLDEVCLYFKKHGYTIKE